MNRLHMVHRLQIPGGVTALRTRIWRNRTAMIEMLLAATLLFNLLDLVLTLIVVEAGLAVEANPAMAALLQVGGLPFALCKLGLVSAGVWILWRHRRRQLAFAGATGICTAYAMVALYHVRSIDAVWGWLAHSS